MTVRAESQRSDEEMLWAMSNLTASGVRCEMALRRRASQGHGLLPSVRESVEDDWDEVTAIGVAHKRRVVELLVDLVVGGVSGGRTGRAWVSGRWS